MIFKTFPLGTFLSCQGIQEDSKGISKSSQVFEKSSIYKFTDCYHLLIIKTFPFGTLLSCQGLHELFRGIQKDSKMSSRGIQENVSFRYLHKSPRTLLMALLSYKTFRLWTLLSHQGFQEVFKGNPRCLKLLMITFLSWWKNLEQLSLIIWRNLSL